MIKPYDSLRKYLLQLIGRYGYVKLYKRQLDILDEWKGIHRIDTLNKGATFFRLVELSFTRSMLLELCLLVSPKEEINIVKWLEKVRIHSKSLKPTKSTKEGAGRKSRTRIKDHVYKEIIKYHKDELEKHDSLINNLLGLRDKIYAHYDPSFFNDPAKLYKKYKILPEELESLMNTLECILGDHHSYLFSCSIADFNIHSYSNVDMILRYARAFMRIRTNKKMIIEKGISPADYLNDEYTNII